MTIRYSRREFIALVTTSTAGIFAGCSSTTVPVDAGGVARLKARPATPTQSVEKGLGALNLAFGRDGKLYVPQSYSPDKPVPLLILLHGATGSGASWFGSYGDRAETHGCILLAPDSRGVTWDFLEEGFGPDIAFIDRALEHTFDHCAIDPARIAIAGFSDGASYALSLALPNGDFFSQAIAYSPGFFVEPAVRGTPECFVSHGKQDSVLSEPNTRTEIVPRLRELGCTVTYVPFIGDHEVPATISTQAMSWLGALWSA